MSTRRLAESVEGLNSSLAAGDLCPKKGKPIYWLARSLKGLINDDVFVSAATTNACFMIHLVCLFMKRHLLALVQDNCFDLVHCASLRKLSGCVRNITAFCQHLLRPISIYQQNPNIGRLYWPGRYIGLSLLWIHGFF